MKRLARVIATSSFRESRRYPSLAEPVPPARDDRMARFLGYCVSVVAILGIPSGLYGYFSAEHAKRIQNTFEFYKDFRSEPFQKNYQALINLADKDAELIHSLMAQYRDNVPERDRKVLAVITAEAESVGGTKALSAVLLFFDGLAACVKTSLCDNNAAAALFNIPSREIASAYGPYILLVRDKLESKRYGTGLFQTRALESEWSLF